MSPPEDCTREPGHAQRAEPRKRPARRPRTRPCLLKGCERRFRPRRARDRYCSAECRQAARKWSRWKAQLRYRATAAGKEKRNGQSRRYRERVRNRPQATPEEALAETARVIPPKFFSITVATAPAATRDSPESGDRRTSASVRARAGAPWRGSGSVSGAGAAPCSSSGTGEPMAAQISLTY